MNLFLIYYNILKTQYKDFHIQPYEFIAKNKQNAFFEDAYSKKNYQNAIKLLEKFSFDVDKFKDKTAKELPQGARKVLDILIAIIGKPKVILLDEPTSGISTDEKNVIMKNIRFMKLSTK